MRPENQRMQDFLRKHGINCHAKFVWTGSLKGTWRLWAKGKPWTPVLADQLTALGFRDFDSRILGNYSGNGGRFSVFVRGHYELVGTDNAVVRTAQARADFVELHTNKGS